MLAVVEANAPLNGPLEAMCWGKSHLSHPLRITCLWYGISKSISACTQCTLALSSCMSRHTTSSVGVQNWPGKQHVLALSDSVAACTLLALGNSPNPQHSKPWQAGLWVDACARKMHAQACCSKCTTSSLTDLWEMPLTNKRLARLVSNGSSTNAHDLQWS